MCIFLQTTSANTFGHSWRTTDKCVADCDEPEAICQSDKKNVAEEKCAVLVDEEGEFKVHSYIGNLLSKIEILKIK